MNSLGNKFRQRRRGVTLVYSTIMLVAIFGIASLAVDFGRVQVAKVQLQQAADAAARFAGAGLETSTTQARTNAAASAGENSVDGSAITLTSQDIEFGLWDSSNRTFTVLADDSLSVNAVRVSARRTAARGTGVPLVFGAMIGKSAADISAQATASFQRGIEVDLAIPASSNPWLAGQPNGTNDNTHRYNSRVRNDVAGPYTDPGGVFHPQGESPSLMSGIPLVAGSVLTFDAIAGTGQHGSTQIIVGPDGNPNSVYSAYAGAHFGLSNLTAPIDSVVGVFLTDSNPSSGSTPGNLNFATPGARDFTSLSPALKQPFFIGDGRTSGGAIQEFVVPAGATRLYIGKMDGTEWNNNLGTSTVTIHRPSVVRLVR